MDGVVSVEETFTNFLPGVDDTVVITTGVTLPSGPISIAELGSSVYIPVELIPSNASNQNVIWTSSPEGIIEVEFGVIRSIAVGSTVLTATTEDGGYTDTIVVKVN